jgi:hypothetical protein
MRAGIAKNFQGFSSVNENGALMGPWNPWLHEPQFGKPIWELTKALSLSPSLPNPFEKSLFSSRARSSEQPMKSMLTLCWLSNAVSPTTRWFEVPVPEPEATRTVHT